MPIEDVWLNNLRVIVDSLSDVRRNGTPNLRSGYRAVADLSGVNEEYVYQLYKGRPLKNGVPPAVGKDAADKITKAFGAGRPAGWFDVPIGRAWQEMHYQSTAPDSFASVLPVAQESIQATYRIDPITIGWGSLLSKPLPQRFRLHLQDDAMALDEPPSMRLGDWAEFVPTNTATPNHVVLVKDKLGNLYIRRVAQKRPGHWVALARHKGYEPLDSIDDGLQVLAVQVGAGWG